LPAIGSSGVLTVLRSLDTALRWFGPGANGNFAGANGPDPVTSDSRVPNVSMSRKTLRNMDPGYSLFRNEKAIKPLKAPSPPFHIRESRRSCAPGLRWFRPVELV